MEGVTIPFAILLLLAAIAALYAWYTRIKARGRRRALTEAQEDAQFDRRFMEILRKEGLIPLETVNNQGLRERLGLKKGEPPASDPISNRRTRRRDRRISSTAPAPLVQPFRNSGHGSWPPRRPDSVYTVANSIDRRSVSPLLSSSPWSSMAPPLPVNPTSPQDPVASRSSRARDSDSSSPPPRPCHTSVQPIISPLPRAFRAQQVVTSLQNDSDARTSSAATRLSPLASSIPQSETQHSLRFYRDEQVAMQQAREALSKKRSVSSLC